MATEKEARVIALAYREWLRFFRQKGRIIGSLATPLLFWLLLGTGLGSAFPSLAAGGDNFLKFFFPGNLMLTLLFTSIFANISLIEDRNEGFLQGVLVSPTPRSSIVWGKVLGGSAIAVFQGLLFLCLAPAAGYELSALTVLRCLPSLLFTAFSLTAIGFFFAWKTNSTQAFHSIMNVVLFPLWLLSGAFFPLEGAPSWLHFLIWVNPVTYGVAGVRAALSSSTILPFGLSIVLLTVIQVGFALGFAGLATWLVIKVKGAEA